MRDKLKTMINEDKGRGRRKKVNIQFRKDYL